MRTRFDSAVRWAACVSVAILTGAATVSEVHAQPVRPAVVKNVDEPGRTPWQVYLVSARGESGCGSNYCAFQTATVPANKRLVITNVTVTVNLEAAGVAQHVRLAVREGVTTTLELVLPSGSGTYPPDPISIGNPKRHVVNEQIRLYVEAGQAVRADFHVSGGSLVPDWRNSFLLTGYLVDLTQ